MAAVGVDPGDGVVGRVRYPHRTVPEGDRSSAVPDLDRPHLPQRLRVDLRHRTIELVHDPDLPLADGDARRAVTDGDPVDGAAVVRNSQQQVGSGVRDPNGTRARGDPARLAASLDHHPYMVSSFVDDADA